jgi:hypothetical protein
MPQTKYEKMKALIGRETAWQGGRGTEFECDGINSAWFLDRLAFLASNAPDHLIEDLIVKCAEAT